MPHPDQTMSGAAQSPFDPIAESDSISVVQDRSAELHGGIIDLARSTLGTPFRHQGRQPGIGLDCVGLVLWVGHRLGLTRYDLTAYSRFPRERQLLTHAVEAGFLEAKRPFAGCVLCLRLLELPQHLAIMTDRGMIHACQNTGRVIEHRMDSTWRNRVVALLRYPGT